MAELLLPFVERVERIEEQPADEMHRWAIERGARCHQCPLFGNHEPVLGEIRTGSYLTVVAEAPGPTEVEKGAPMQGWSGGEMDRALLAGGLSRESVSVTNAVLCQPPGIAFGDFMERVALKDRRKHREWEYACREAEAQGLPKPPEPVKTMSPQEACLPRLKRDLEESGAKTILAIGARALESIAWLEGTTPGGKHIAHLADQHGAPVQLSGGRVLMSAYHPAGAVKGRVEMLPIIRENMTRAAVVATRGWSWPEPPFTVFPSADEVIRLIDAFVAEACELVVDIETGPSGPGAKDAANVRRNVLRCIGVGTVYKDQEVVFCIPVRHMDGSLWYSEADTERVRRCLQHAFDRLPLVGQNFQFDTSVLLRDGYMTDHNKSYSDTLLLHKNSCDNDLPHNLSFITRQFFTLPVWKDVDHDSMDNVGDRDLHVYNCKDVLSTMRVLPSLRNRTVQYDCVQQYRVDESMAPLCRNMGAIGLPIDEHIRGAFSVTFNRECQALAAKAREMIGREINLNSPDQLKDLFYGDPKFGGWGLEPRIATDGYEWDQDKEGSTGSQALVELRKAGVGDLQQAFIDNLLDFRAYAKLKGTYVDNLPSYPATFSLEGIADAPAVQGWAWKDGRDVWEEVLPVRAGMSVFHATFKNYVVPGGRLSATPNVQAVPAIGKANIRKMFCAVPGHSFVGADWSQLEARLYAIASGDAVLLETLRSKHEATGEPLDIHTMNAASLFATNTSREERMYWYDRIEYGVGLPFNEHMPPPERIRSLSFREALEASQAFIRDAAEAAGWKNPESAFKDIHSKFRKRVRTIAKRFVFLVLYGGEKEKLYSVMSADRNKESGELTFKDLTPDQCLFWYDNWHAAHPETHQWHLRCERVVRKHGCIRVLDGFDRRARWFIAGVSKKNAVPNHQIQGTAASLANECLMMIAHEIPFRKWSPWSGLCLQVHDDIKVMVPDNRVEEAKSILHRIMNRTIQGVDIPATVVASKNWAKQDG